MRTKFVETESRYQAKKQCPWAEKRGMYRHLIKKSVDTGKPYKGILYKEEK